MINKVKFKTEYGVVCDNCEKVLLITKDNVGEVKEEMKRLKWIIREYYPGRPKDFCSKRCMDIYDSNEFNHPSYGG